MVLFRVGGVEQVAEDEAQTQRKRVRGITLVSPEDDIRMGRKIKKMNGKEKLNKR
jgi:hypothetical protein